MHLSWASVVWDILVSLPAKVMIDSSLIIKSVVIFFKVNFLVIVSQVPHWINLNLKRASRFTRWSEGKHLVGCAEVHFSRLLFYVHCADLVRMSLLLRQSQISSSDLNLRVELILCIFVQILQFSLLPRLLINVCTFWILKDVFLYGSYGLA